MVEYCCNIALQCFGDSDCVSGIRHPVVIQCKNHVPTIFRKFTFGKVELQAKPAG